MARAKKIALLANTIGKIPDNLDFDRAAGIIIIYGTALHALEDRASLKAGETMAVLARPAALASRPANSAN